MKKFFTNFILYIGVFVFALSGCAKQEKIDILTFSERLNAQTKAEIFHISDGISLKGTDKTYFKTTIGKEHLPVYCSFKENEKKEITALECLCLSKDVPSDESLEAFWNLFIEAVAILENKEKKAIEEEMQALSLSANELSFAPSHVEKEQGKWRYVFICRKESIALFCERMLKA